MINALQKYEQHICKNGHRFDKGISWGTIPSCPICNKLSAWYNSVDNTNGNELGIITNWLSLLMEPEEKQMCNLGHEHIIKHARYRIPSKKETCTLRNVKSCTFCGEFCYQKISTLTEKQRVENKAWLKNEFSTGHCPHVELPKYACEKCIAKHPEVMLVQPVR